MEHILGAVLFLAFVAGAVYYVRRKKKVEREYNTPGPGSPKPPGPRNPDPQAEDRGNDYTDEK